MEVFRSKLNASQPTSARFALAREPLTLLMSTKTEPRRKNLPPWGFFLVVFCVLFGMGGYIYTSDGQSHLANFAAALLPAVILGGTASLTIERGAWLKGTYGGAVATFFTGFILLETFKDTAPRLAVYDFYYEDGKQAFVDTARVAKVGAGDASLDWILGETHNIIVIGYPQGTDKCRLILGLPEGEAICELEYAKDAKAALRIGTQESSECRLTEK